MYPWMAPNRMNTVAADDGWQLYDTTNDFSLSNDLAAQYPDRLAAMKQKFMEEAVENQVLPLDDRLLERLAVQLRRHGQSTPETPDRLLSAPASSPRRPKHASPGPRP